MKMKGNKVLIEVSDDDIDMIIRSWLKYCIEAGKAKYDHEDDRKFWEELSEKCRWILENNYFIKLND